MNSLFGIDQSKSLVSFLVFKVMFLKFEMTFKFNVNNFVKTEIHLKMNPLLEINQLKYTLISFLK